MSKYYFEHKVTGSLEIEVEAETLDEAKAECERCIRDVAIKMATQTHLVQIDDDPVEYDECAGCGLPIMDGEPNGYYSDENGDGENMHTACADQILDASH